VRNVYALWDCEGRRWFWSAPDEQLVYTSQAAARKAAKALHRLNGYVLTVELVGRCSFAAPTRRPRSAE
jgi:hypothetical protein